MIRYYQEGDHVAISEIFQRAIHEIASEVYTHEQCSVWSEKNPDPAHWKQRCKEKSPFVFIQNDKVVGFLELDPDGHIDCLYVHPEAKRKGVASALIDHAMGANTEAGNRRMYVEASICAKTVFEKKGFVVVKEKEVEIGSVKMINYNMELKQLVAYGSGNS
jgi:putative acetyltransferase